MLRVLYGMNEKHPREPRLEKGGSSSDQHKPHNIPTCSYQQDVDRSQAMRCAQEVTHRLASKMAGVQLCSGKGNSGLPDVCRGFFWPGEVWKPEIV